MSTTTLLVRRDRLDQTRIVETPDLPLADGQVRVRIDRFALTSNNITYAAFGEAMNYWKFFPTAQEGWGVVPVWGFADVVQSLHPGLAAGERLYGYWPMADHAVLEPSRLSVAGFSDAAAHRRELHGVYNQYLRCSADPFYSADSEDVQALLRPLFTTSWLIDDFLADNAFFGADTMLLSSASSKTGYGTANQLAQRSGLQVVGLTSARHKAFCQRLGCYSKVLAYEELDQLPSDLHAVYVDFAGNAGLRRDIHRRFPKLGYSCSVGGTHVDQLGGGKDLAGPRPVLFFAPAQVKKRQGDWGAAELGRRLAQDWQRLLARVGNPDAPWLAAVHHDGAAAVQAAYAQVLAGQGDPALGHILSLSRS
ncbi:DUF2855 family protein [Caenimonas terrae]|uniref:DUF2855 family protein n=1 Tax=Caenimonas terrae TaxID=696074 RepID=A0ABW0NAF6_9BURK